MESLHENPRIAAIDIALSKLEGTIVELANQWGYKIVRTGDGSFDVPHRWITRTAGTDDWQTRHTVTIRIGVPITDRLERGFYPRIPLNVASQATMKRFHPYNEFVIAQPILEGLLYSDASALLPDLFLKAKTLHERWDADYISEHGETTEELIAKAKDGDKDSCSAS